MPKIRVLVVDDAVVVRKLITATLERDPELEVVGVAAHGRIALQKIPQVNPDLLTLDVEMPELDGLATLREVRKLYPKLAVIMFSTLTEKGAAATLDALALGANDYVAKPFDPGELLARVEVGRHMVEMQDTLAGKIEELRQAVNQIKTLRGIVPICANCKKIRDDRGYWNQVEVYVRDHTEAEFSHGICPDCMQKVRAEFDQNSGHKTSK